MVWLLNAASVYVLCYSFDIGLSYAGACFVTVCIALAVALPQAPGFIGVFHIATQKSLDVFGIGLSSAQSFAILLWAISVIPVTIAGLLFLWREGISFGEISHYDEIRNLNIEIRNRSKITISNIQNSCFYILRICHLNLFRISCFNYQYLRLMGFLTKSTRMM